MKRLFLITILLSAFCTMMGICCNAIDFDSDLKLLYVQDYEGVTTGFKEPADDYYDDIFEIKTDANGNKYMDVTVVQGSSALSNHIAGYAMTWGYGDINFEYGVVAGFDVCKLSEGAPVVFEMNDYDNGNKFAYVGFRSTDIPETNVWYTVEIRYIGRNGEITLWNKSTGEKYTAEPVYSLGGLSREKNSFRFVGDTQRMDVFGALIPEGYTVYDTHYCFDNIKVYSYTPQVRSDVRFEEDYDDFEAESVLSDAAVIRKNMYDLNYFAEIDIIGPAGGYVYSEAEIPGDNFRVTFDVKKVTESTSFNLEIHTVDSVSYVYSIPAVQLDSSVWYTYRIERVDGEVKAYQKSQDENEFREITVYSADEANSVTATGVVDISDVGAVGFFGGDEGAKPSDSSYAIDNVLIENINTAKVTAEMEKDTIHLYSDIFGTLDEEKQAVCKAILVCYDNEGVAFEIRSADVSATKGKGSVTFDIVRADDASTEVVENATFAKVKNGGRAKVFFWKGFENLFPLTAELDVTELLK